MNALTRAALAAALSITAAGAFAQSTGTATASVTNFGYTLVDLDPNDGIAPQLTWTQLVSESYGRSTLQNYGTSPWPTFTTIGSEDRIDMAGSTTSFVLDNASASTTASTATATAYAGEYGAWQTTAASVGGYFTLSANTAVTFTADASASASGTLVPGTPRPVNTDWAYYSAGATVEIGSWLGKTATSPGDVSSFLPSSPQTPYGMFMGASAGSSTESKSASKEQQLSITFRNATGASAAYNVGVSAYVDVYTMAPAVPEPGTWVLTGIGLAAAGWLGRRRAGRTAG